MNFLKNRQQRVVLYGQSLSWTKVNAGAPQRLILGTFIFLESHKRIAKQFTV